MRTPVTSARALTAPNVDETSQRLSVKATALRMQGNSNTDTGEAVWQRGLLDGLTRASLVVVLLSSVVSVQAQSLQFATPKGWTAQPTSSPMRVAQYVLPREASDKEDGELVVYYFGGQGGSIDANLDRWLGQMQQADGRPSKSVAKTEKLSVNGLALTVLDVTGRYVAEVAPGSPAKHDKPGFRLKAAVIETPAGPYFVKLTGPSRTVARWDAAFSGFLKSARFRPGARD